MSEWHPIATAPKDGTLILLYGPLPVGRKEAKVARWRKGEWTIGSYLRGGTEVFLIFESPAYWRQLPELPPE